MLDLTEKAILVTGASSGIGRSSAILISQLGGSVILSGRNKEKLNDSLSRMNREKVSHQVIPGELSTNEQCTKFVEELASKHLKIDGVVHCAGISETEPLRFITPESTDKIIDLNVKSALYLISGIRKKRLFNKNASVIFLSSMAAIIGEPGIAAYSASKGALISLTKSLAAELASPDQVRVNCLAPAIVETELIEEKFKHFSNEAVEALRKKHPLGFGKPEDIANTISFFLSNAASWITGSCLIIDGGYSLVTG